MHVLINDAEEESVTQRATRTLCHSAPLTLLCRFTWATHTRPRPDESFDEVLGEGINTKKGSFDLVFMIMIWKLDDQEDGSSAALMSTT